MAEEKEARGLKLRVGESYMKAAQNALLPRTTVRVDGNRTIITQRRESKKGGIVAFSQSTVTPRADGRYDMVSTEWTSGDEQRHISTYVVDKDSDKLKWADHIHELPALER